MAKGHEIRERKPLCASQFRHRQHSYRTPNPDYFSNFIRRRYERASKRALPILCSQQKDQRSAQTACPGGLIM